MYASIYANVTASLQTVFKQGMPKKQKGPGGKTMTPTTIRHHNNRVYPRDIASVRKASKHVTLHVPPNNVVGLD